MPRLALPILLLLATLLPVRADLFGPDQKVHAAEVRALADGRPLKMRLYSLDAESRSFWRPWGSFGGYVVTGEARLTSPDHQRILLRAIAHGIERSTMVGLCFWPHHGVRIEHDDRTTDILICLSCAGVSVTGIADGWPMPFSAAPGEVIEKIFAASGLKPRSE